MKIKKKQLYIITASVIAVVLLMWLHLGGHTRNSDPVEVKIYPGCNNYDDVVCQLDSLGVRPNKPAFATLSILKMRGGSKLGIHPGRYIIEPRTSTLNLVRKLYHGQEDPIRLTLKKYRTREQLSAYLEKNLMYDSVYWMSQMTDTTLLHQFGLTSETVLSIFIPNTYEVYWSVTGEQFVARMKKESDRFWNESRKAKAAAMGLSPVEVITLASIVDEETNKNDEKPFVASVYINRLNKGMCLQADPTVKYAVGDFLLQRILNKHLEVESPYNTYKNKGLPPGPICTPTVASIDAVLENHPTPYLYFCAKEDFSGYHNFAATLSQHNANAARFHRALNQRGIK